jgi:thiol-disulfide isomerase/thioredoxin
MTAFILCLALISCAQKKEGKSFVSGREGSTMPNLNILLSDSTGYFNTASIKNGKPTIFFYFKPTCPYCRLQTRRIVNNMKEYKDVNFCMIAYKPLKQLEKYRQEFEIEKYSNVKIGRDTGYGFVKLFPIPTVPFTAVYNREKKLVKTYFGALSKRQLDSLTHII